MIQCCKNQLMQLRGILHQCLLNPRFLLLCQSLGSYPGQSSCSSFQLYGSASSSARLVISSLLARHSYLTSFHSRVRSDHSFDYCSQSFILLNCKHCDPHYQESLPFCAAVHQAWSSNGLHRLDYRPSTYLSFLDYLHFYLRLFHLLHKRRTFDGCWYWLALNALDSRSHTRQEVNRKH